MPSGVRTQARSTTSCRRLALPRRCRSLATDGPASCPAGSLRSTGGRATYSQPRARPWRAPRWPSRGSRDRLPTQAARWRRPARDGRSPPGRIRPLRSSERRRSLGPMSPDTVRLINTPSSTVEHLHLIGRALRHGQEGQLPRRVWRAGAAGAHTRVRSCRLRRRYPASAPGAAAARAPGAAARASEQALRAQALPSARGISDLAPVSSCNTTVKRPPPVSGFPAPWALIVIHPGRAE
jgi:hypothetical protein